MTNRIYLNTKKLVEDLIKVDSIEDLDCAPLRKGKSYKFVSKQLESFHLEFIHLSPRLEKVASIQFR